MFIELRKLRERHRQLSKKGQYDWSLFELWFKTKILGTHLVEIISEESIVFFIMLIQRSSSGMLKIIAMRTHSDYLKKSIPYWFNIKMQEFATSGYNKIVIVLNKEKNQKEIDLFIEDLSFKINKTEALADMLEDKDNQSNKVTLTRKLRKNAE